MNLEDICDTSILLALHVTTSICFILLLQSKHLTLLLAYHNTIIANT